MLFEDVLRGEIVLWVDFNNLKDDERLPTTLRYATGPRKPGVGDWVHIMDSDGDSCLAQVLRVEGMLVEVRPDWSTWKASAPRWSTWSPPRQAAKRTANLREALRRSRQRPSGGSSIEDSPLAEHPTASVGS